jgi:hypothetical protein
VAPRGPAAPRAPFLQFWPFRAARSVHSILAVGAALSISQLADSAVKLSNGLRRVTSDLANLGDEHLVHLARLALEDSPAELLDFSAVAMDLLGVHDGSVCALAASLSVHALGGLDGFAQAGFATELAAHSNSLRLAVATELPTQKRLHGFAAATKLAAQEGSQLASRFVRTGALPVRALRALRPQMLITNLRLAAAATSEISSSSSAASSSEDASSSLKSSSSKVFHVFRIGGWLLVAGQDDGMVSAAGALGLGGLDDFGNVLGGQGLRFGGLLSSGAELRGEQ